MVFVLLVWLIVMRGMRSTSYTTNHHLDATVVTLKCHFHVSLNNQIENTQMIKMYTMNHFLIFIAIASLLILSINKLNTNLWYNVFNVKIGFITLIYCLLYSKNSLSLSLYLYAEHAQLIPTCCRTLILCIQQ